MTEEQSRYPHLSSAFAYSSDTDGMYQVLTATYMAENAVKRTSIAFDRHISVPVEHLVKALRALADKIEQEEASNAVR
jgi:hypothetical protein